MTKFTKTEINFWLDTFLLILFVIYAWITIILRFVFPPATKAEGWTLWGFDYLVWTDIQFAVLAVFASCILLHVMLHWSWVCGVVTGWFRKRRNDTSPKQDNGTRTLWGVALLIAICNFIGIGLALAVLMIREPLP
jgi:hypothetical protein